ncbi:DivIVA domain-containing protein [Dermacoccus sp. PAMC28757]|nr:DivIVA domain-containing protein [Dermacoccus sp. PAMC28757]
MKMITAHEVRTAQFHRADAGKVGYDEVGVDDYLDRVADTLEAIERGGQMPSHAVSANDVVEVVFSERGPQSAGGYDLDDVDDLLDRVAQRIRAYEDGVRRASAPVDAGLPSDVEADDRGDVRDERTDGADEREHGAHGGHGVAAAGAAGAGVAGAAAYERREDRADVDPRGDVRDDRYDERGFVDERDLRDERRPEAYAEPAAPELQDSPRSAFADDGGVRDGEALAVAGGAPRREERFDDERGFEPADERRGGFGEPGVRVDEVSDAAAFDGRRDENVADERAFDGRERRDERGFDGRDAGLVAGGGAVAAGGAAAAHGQRDERRDDAFASDTRDDVRDDRAGDAGAGRQGGVNMVGSDPVDEAPIMAPDESGRNRELRSDDRSDVNTSHDAAYAPPAERDTLANDSAVTPEERFDAERRDDVVRDEQLRNEPFADERRDADLRDERGFEGEREERSSGFGPAAAGGAAAGGYAAHRHSDQGEQVERNEWAPRDERDAVRIDGEPVGDSAGDPVRREHDAADYHDPAAAHSETFAEPVPPQQVSAEEARPVAAAEQGDNWAFEDNGLRRDRAPRDPDEGAILLQGEDEGPRADERFQGSNAYEGDAVAGGDAVADERPIATQPEIVSYRATDRRVPLPRSEARRSMSDEDREAEAQYHPEYSAYSSPEDGAGDSPRRSTGGAYDESASRPASDLDRGPDAGVLPTEQAPLVDDRPVAPEAPVAQDARRDGEFDPFSEPSAVTERPLPTQPNEGGEAPQAAPPQTGGFERDPFADDAGRDSFERPEQPARAETFGGRGTDGPQRVAPMNEETARVREPREGGFEQPGVGNRDPFADDARRDGSFDVAGGGDDVREQQSFEASSPVADDRRASDVERPESIDRPQPIDKAEPLPERDDTSRKGLLRRIFKG